MTPFQILPTIPEDYVGNYSLSSEIAVHPSGKWLYVSNRGHNSIAVFSIDPFSGTLKILGWQSTLGEIPRYFSIEPGGRLLYAANQKSGTIQVFSIDLETGLLSFSFLSVVVPVFSVPFVIVGFSTDFLLSSVTSAFPTICPS